MQPHNINPQGDFKADGSVPLTGTVTSDTGLDIVLDAATGDVINNDANGSYQLGTNIVLNATADVVTLANIAAIDAATATAIASGLDFLEALTERAAAPAAPTAGQGQVWVKNDAPQNANSIQFTDDTGTDHSIGGDLKSDGTVAMTGTLDMGSQTIDSVTAINGTQYVPWAAGDLTTTLQTALTAGGRIILEPGQSYSISGTLNVTANGTILDLNDAEISSTTVANPILDLSTVAELTTFKLQNGTLKYSPAAKRDFGTSTSGTSTTLVDTSKAWTTDEWDGSFVECNGETHEVLSNTSNTLTIAGPWTTTPVTDSYNVGDIYAIGIRMQNGTSRAHGVTLDEVAFSDCYRAIEAVDGGASQCVFDVTMRKVIIWNCADYAVYWKMDTGASTMLNFDSIYVRAQDTVGSKGLYLKGIKYLTAGTLYLEDLAAVHALYTNQVYGKIGNLTCENANMTISLTDGVFEFFQSDLSIENLEVQSGAGDTLTSVANAGIIFMDESAGGCWLRIGTYRDDAWTISGTAPAKFRLANTSHIWVGKDYGTSGWADTVTHANFDGTIRQIGNDVQELVFDELADHSSTPAPGKGYLWTKSTTPSTLIFTDDAGTDFTLGAGGTPEGTAVLSTGEVGGTKFLREDGDGTCSWQVPAGSGDVTKVGTPANDQVGVWTGDGTIEGTAGLTFASNSLNIGTGAPGTITTTNTFGLTLNSGSDIITLGDGTTVTVTTATNASIDLSPNGTGNVLLGNFEFDADQTVGVGQDNYVLTYDNGTGLISLEAATGGVPTTITVADESADTTCFVAFFTAATGDLAPKSGTNLTFNSSTGALTATSFVGSLTGQADTVATIAGLAPDTATTAAAQPNITSTGALTVASSVAVTNNGATAAFLSLEEPNGDSTVTITVPALAANYTLTLPTTDGAPNEFLQTNGSGVLTWAVPAGSGDMVLASEQTITGAKTFDTGTLLLNDTDSVFDLALASTSTITTANKTLTFDVNDANRTLTIGASTTLSGGTHSGTNTGDETQGSINALLITDVGTITTGTWTGTSIAVANGGTGLSAGTSGGILGYTATGTLASSVLLGAGDLVVGGGAGATPTSVAAGATTTILVGGGAGVAPVWTTATGSGAPVRADSPIFTTDITTPKVTNASADLTMETTTSGDVVLSPAGVVNLNAVLQLTERTSDPGNPAEGEAWLWMSNGSAVGADGDLMVRITAGATTKTYTLIDFSL